MSMKFNKKIPTSFRNILLIIAVCVASLAALSYVAEVSKPAEVLTYSQFLDHVENDHVASVEIVGNNVQGAYKSGKVFKAIIADNPKNWDILRKHDVAFSVQEHSQLMTPWQMLFFIFLGGLVLLAIWFFRSQSRGSGGSGSIFSMGKSKAKMFMPSQIRIKFSDIAGAKEAKEELQDIVDFLKNPKKYEKVGARLTRGVLLVGEPGNGKTLLAKAVAGEANCPFFSITGSDFIEVFVGVGAARIRDLFEQVRRQQRPCIIFIDEVDAIGRKRGSGLGGGHDEREQTLNQLLTEMDGFATSDIPVIVIAATNMPSVLDKALLRPGRFDRRITVPYPDEEARRRILEINAGQMSFSPDLDLDKIIEQSAGFSGADLVNCINQAAINASKQSRSVIEQEDFEIAFTKLARSRRTSESEQKAGSGEGESTARVYMPSQIKVRFSDVAGAAEAKEELQDFIDYLKNPNKYKKLGAKLTKGILMAGDPGNGKTLLARAVAGEAGRPFFSVSGSEFIEKYVGVGASRVRDLFVQARKHAPAIIFIDEIDAIGGHRNGGSNSEHTQTLNQLLTEMDGFHEDEDPVIVIAATNRPDILDTALTRPGRFDRQVQVPYPSLKDRRDILTVHTKNVKLGEEVNLDRVARSTTGFSGAQLASLVNEAALNAVRHERVDIGIKDFEEAHDKIVLGKESKSIQQTPEDLKATAYHEAGHVLMTLLQPEHTHPLHKVTILPRGHALGFAASLPERDRYSHSREELTAQIIVALGGRVGEELGMGRQFTGVTSDLKQASRIARTMVRLYGMSESLGLVSYGDSQEYSEATANKIDEEVRNVIAKCYDTARSLMKDNEDKLQKLTQALIEKETLHAEEIYELLAIEPRVIHKIS